MKVATGSFDKRLRIVDVASGAVEVEVLHGSHVQSVVWSPSGMKVATGSLDKRLRIVDAASGAVELEVPHGSDVQSVAWSP